MAAKKTPPPPPAESPDDAPAASDAPESGSTTSGAAPGPQPEGNRFFSWMRETGILRQPGWIGGVASGLGVRLGIDPIVVRGVLVVVAVLGGPALLLYAAAWLLLPDRDNRIHAQELLRGRFDPALIGIGVMVLLSLLPLAQGFWYTGALYWGDLSWAASLGRVLWTAVVLTAIVLFVIWAARRTQAFEPTVTPATTDDKPDTVPTPNRPSESRAASAAVPLPGPPAPPAAPAADAAAEELQSWKEQQALWKQQHAEWKAQRAVTDRELREQRAAEARERALAAAARSAEERRLHRLANPRITAATVFSVLGAAILAGGLSALAASTSPQLSGYEVTVALAVAALVLGLGIVISGLCRRRSGALGFFAVLVVLAMLVSTAVPRDRLLLLPSSYGVGVGESARFAQPFGTLGLTVLSTSRPGVTDIWQGTGRIELYVPDGLSVNVELVSGSGRISVYGDFDDSIGWTRESLAGLHRVGDEWMLNSTIGSAAPGTPILRVWQGSGDIIVYDDNRATIEEETP